MPEQEHDMIASPEAQASKAYDSLEIPASVAAKALDMSVRTMNYWLTEGEVKGFQKISGRWWTTVGELRRVIAERGQVGTRTESHFERYLEEKIIPKYGKGDGETSTDVLDLSEDDGQPV